MTNNLSVDPELVRSLQGKFDNFSRHDDAAGEPLYIALAAAAAATADWAGLLAAAPATQRSPTLWLAALQSRLLGRVARGDQPALADYYASAGGRRAPDAGLTPALGEFIDEEREALRELIATRSTQTNEIGRSVVLWPVLRRLAARAGRTRVALLDVGCSAGLNLGVDRWRYRYVDDVSGQPIAGHFDRDRDRPEDSSDATLPHITCRVLPGAATPFDGQRADARDYADVWPRIDIVSRLGIDPKPVSVDDADAVAWLRACLWPHDASRRDRFDAAVAEARAQRWPVRASADTTAAVCDWLDGVPDDVLPVVFNSWVLAYFDADALRHHVEQLQRAIVRRHAVWVSAEPESLARRWWPGLPAPVLSTALSPSMSTSVQARELATATAWTVASADGRGGVAWHLAARSHAHGRWMQWLA